MTTTLNHITPGWTVCVTAVSGNGPIRQRLVEMGIMKGVTLRVQRIAPLGDPMEIRLQGCSVTLRKQEAARIEVERVAPPGARHRLQWGHAEPNTSCRHRKG